MESGVDGVWLASAHRPSEPTLTPSTLLREQVVEDGGELDGAVALHAVAGAVDHDHVDIAASTTGLGDVLVVNDG